MRVWKEIRKQMNMAHRPLRAVKELAENLPNMLKAFCPPFHTGQVWLARRWRYQESGIRS